MIKILRYIALSTIMLVGTPCFAQSVEQAPATAAAGVKKMNIPVEKGEMWWGGYVSMGSQMPFLKPMERMSLIRENRGNQSAPFFVSNYGRFIWSSRPFDFTFDGQQFVVESDIEVQAEKVGKSLREAYLVACNRHFPPTGKIPDELFFAVPQYNTWIELVYNQNQADVEKYAADILSHGFPAGVLMIDDNWQKDYGNFEFRPDKFPNPKAMVDKLHQQGFKVMLWITPFVSPDGAEFRDLEKRGYLIKRKGSDEADVVRWWNGYSACYDLTNTEAYNHLLSILKNMQTQYGIDGFKFDAGDPNFYTETQTSAKAGALPTDHAAKWAELGMEFGFNEFRAGWDMQGKHLVQRLGDKDYSWDALKLLVPEMIASGLMGFPYTCPDMIGGGQFGSFVGVDPTTMDQNLIVRSAQVHAMMPMMQFSVAPWRVLDAEHLGYCLEAVKLHQSLAKYILELAHEAAKSGEPIVRHMEYMFPHKGFVDCNDQYMLGSHYLVAPVTSADGRRTVRLPKGQWTDDTGKRFRGPLVMEITAPAGRLPYYVKK